MLRISILGDSWIRRLETSLEETISNKKLYEAETQWVWLPGFTCFKVRDCHFQQVANSHPDIVVLHVRGNKLAELDLPTIVATNILEVRRTLLVKEAKRVMVTEVPPRVLRRKRDANKVRKRDANKVRKTQTRLLIH